MPSGGDTSAVGLDQKASAVSGSVSQQNFQNGENQPPGLKRRSLSFRLKERLPFTKAKAERKRALADQVVVCVLNNPASNVADSKQSVSSDPDEIVVTIRFLDDSVPLALKITKYTLGKVVLDRVCEYLQLPESGYFGLRYDHPNKERFWLDPLHRVSKQLKDVNPKVLNFRVRYYPADPLRLKDEVTRYLLYLQLRRDLYRGRLLSSPSDATELAALVLQAELGGYRALESDVSYVSRVGQILPRQSARQEERIREAHARLEPTLSAIDAEARFLARAATFDTYALDPFAVKDEEGQQYYFGVNHRGVVTYQSFKAAHVFAWSDIERFELSGKDIRIRLPTLKKPGFSFGNSLPRRLLREKSATAPPAGGGLSLAATRSSSREPLTLSASPSASAVGPARAPSGPSAATAGSGVGAGVGAGVGLRASSNSPLFLDVPRASPAAANQSSPSDASSGGNSSLSPSPIAGNGTATAGNGSAGNHVSDMPPTLSADAAAAAAGSLSRDTHSPMSLQASPSPLVPGMSRVMYTFKCDTDAAAHSLWLLCVDQQAFFTLARAKDATQVKSSGGKFFSFRRPSKFRFSGNCERELLEQSELRPSTPVLLSSSTVSSTNPLSGFVTLRARRTRELSENTLSSTSPSPQTNGRLSNGELACALQPDSLLVESYSSAVSHPSSASTSRPPAPSHLSSFTGQSESESDSAGAEVAGTGGGGGGGGGGSSAAGGTTSADAPVPLPPPNLFEEAAVRRALPGDMSAAPSGRAASATASTAAVAASASVSGAAGSAQAQRSDASRTTGAHTTKSTSGTGGRSTARQLHTTGRPPSPRAATPASAAGGRTSSGRARRSLWFYLVPSVLFAIFLLFAALVFLLETDYLPAAVRSSTGVAQLDHFYRPYRSRFVTLLRGLQ